MYRAKQLFESIFRLYNRTRIILYYIICYFLFYPEYIEKCFFFFFLQVCRSGGRGGMSADRKKILVGGGKRERFTTKLLDTLKTIIFLSVKVKRSLKKKKSVSKTLRGRDFNTLTTCRHWPTRETPAGNGCLCRREQEKNKRKILIKN